MEKHFFALNGYPGQGLTITRRLIAVIILAAVLVAIVGTEVEAQHLAGPWLARLELSFGLVFSMEYVARVASYAAAVLTTVGYGDVVPAAIAVRAFAVLGALAGVGLIALPAGILAGAFNDAFARQRELRLMAGHTEQETG